MPTRVVILGAAGRDFHNFNVLYRDDPAYDVVAFTATQIPDIAGRKYPPELAGSHYPGGIPILPEDDLETLITDNDIDLVVFSYSDVSHEHVMHLAARAVASGAAYHLPGGETMLESSKPVISVTAARTGSGKSQTSRKIRGIVAASGKAAAAIRHPMPYGNLVKQRLQRFESFEDLDAAEVTIEEREEYEPYIRDGAVIFAGADYAAILEAAEAEAEIILWDGGNNDTPFIAPDIDICVVDPHRAGHELAYWPGEANFRRANVIVVNKVDSAKPEDLEKIRANIDEANPNATVIEAESQVRLEEGASIEGKKVLVVEDGPTTTHGDMGFGAGLIAAKRHGASEILDPRPYAVGSIARMFETYTHLADVLPAMGYGEKQRAELRETIHAAAEDADVIVIGTPIDLARVLDLEVPSVRVFYDLVEVKGPTLEEILKPVVS
ncbi:MAG TPA: GTPase [Acidimicrobiia bacterium]|nr:GTPase [Acidimicrobiia bacterium]